MMRGSDFGLQCFLFWLLLACPLSSTAAADAIFLRSGSPMLAGLDSSAPPETLVVGHDPAEYARIAAEIAPARIYWNIPFPFVRADIEAVTWPDENGNGGAFHARVWSRETAAGPKTYSSNLVDFPMDRVSVSVDFSSMADIRLFFSNIDEWVGPIGSEAWIRAFDRALDPGGEHHKDRHRIGQRQ